MPSCAPRPPSTRPTPLDHRSEVFIALFRALPLARGGAVGRHRRLRGRRGRRLPVRRARRRRPFHSQPAALAAARAWLRRALDRLRDGEESTGLIFGLAAAAATLAGSVAALLLRRLLHHLQYRANVQFAPGGNFLPFQLQGRFAGFMYVRKLNNRSLVIRPQYNLDQLAIWLDECSDPRIIHRVRDIHQAQRACLPFTVWHLLARLTPGPVDLDRWGPGPNARQNGCRASFGPLRGGQLHMKRARAELLLVHH